jgi:hypothetical protein
MLWVTTNERVDQVAGEAFDRSNQARDNLRIRLPRTASASAAVAVLALTVSGCGTDKEARKRCERDAFNTAETAAVSRLYDAGKLGTRQQVEAELGVPGRPGSSFFDASGHLIPYRRLDFAHKNQLVLWMNNGRVGVLTFEAREQARASTRPDCS